MTGHPEPPARGNMRRPLRNRLTFRFSLGLCTGAAIILIGAGALNLHLQRIHLTRLVSASADRIAETIRRATRDAMMRDSAEEVHWMIESIGAQQGITRIRIFNKQGHIRSSTRSEEIGSFVDKRAEQCYACHQQDQPLDRLERADRVRIFSEPGKERTLGIIAPIRNELACSTAACHVHSSQQKVLGVLDVQQSLATVDAELAASENQLLASLAVMILAMLALTGVLTWRIVLRPVRRLQQATTRLAAGDLTSRLEVTSSDEVGDLMDSWNVMTEKLGRAQTEVEEWGHILERRVLDKTRELKKAHQRMLLVEKMASLGKLAAVVAHEINNPLTGIRTYARLLRRRLRSSGQIDKEKPSEKFTATGESTDQVLQFVEEEAGRCGDIVRNLLMFSRTPGARFSEEDLMPLIERCIFLLRHQAELKEINLKIESQGILPRISCDPSQIQQMILALAMNGLEATPKGGSLKIATRALEAEGHVMITVSDSGIGISEELRSQIFEPFFTTKKEGSGVGLGLAVVYGIVNRHHGRIEVESKPESGTIFTILLPVRQPPVERPAQEESREVTS